MASIPDSHDMDKRDDLVASLSRSIFMRESQHAARDYESLTKADPEFRLDGNLQHDLARLLELGNEARLALHAYEQILVHDQEHPLYAQSLRAAGHLAYRLKSHKKCRRYLEKFLESGPATAEARDAESILERLPDGKGAPKHGAGQVAKEEKPAIVRPQPKLEDSQSVSDVHNLPTESSYEELIAIGNVYDETGDAAEADGSPEKKPLSFETSHEAESRNAEPPVPTPPSAEPPALPPFTPMPNDSLEEFGAPAPISDGEVAPPTADLQDDAFAEPDPVAEHDPYAETPPLSIGARDVLRQKSKEKLRDLKPEKREKGPGDTTGWARDPKRHVVHAQSGPALYERLQNAEFAMLLPVGEKIILEQVVEALRVIEDLPEADARLAVLERKGLLRQRLTCEQVLEIQPKIRRLRQKFLFVVTGPELRPPIMHVVRRLDVMKPGLRMHTERGVMKARWEDVQLLSCSRLERKPAVDVFSGSPLTHFRLYEGSMSFSDIDGGAGDPSDACRDFLREVREKCPDAQISHTVRNFLDGRNWRPQKFPDEAEYNLYNQCLLYAHFGETVDVKALAESAAAGSSV